MSSLGKKLPILVYFYGGTFCIESAFSFLDHCYLNSSVSEAEMGRVPFEKSITIVARDLYTPSLKGLGCERVLVCVAEKDPLRDRGVWYGELVKKSGWGGELEVFEVEGEDHAFHVLYPETDNAKIMIKRLAYFLMCK
ncbi:hypothetical protein CDL15_Pgr008538 [Punica granatum]|uniref:Alpha/beta hydrolase fold-3 domain-containing protein n=1 Tax=Punica granatum TaxID=22663 RepID=A0A218WN61_PUNGR|nr:hypothetical protein CDL15_Pgr008538 [Punica granatum]